MVILVLFFCLGIASYIAAIFALVQWRIHRKAGLMVLTVIQFMQALQLSSSLFFNLDSYLFLGLSLLYFVAIFAVAFYMLNKYPETMLAVWVISVLASFGTVVVWSCAFLNNSDVGKYALLLFIAGVFNYMMILVIMSAWVERQEIGLIVLASLLLLQIFAPIIIAAFGALAAAMSFTWFLLVAIISMAFFTLCILLGASRFLGKRTAKDVALYVCALLASIVTPLVAWGSIVMLVD